MQYEVTFIVDPTLSGDDQKLAANHYVEMLKTEGAEIVHVDEWGLRQLAYHINRRNSGFYYTIEFTNQGGTAIDKVELMLRRDERILRFLTVKLDKFGIKFNEDRRAGRIGKKNREALLASVNKAKNDDDDEV